MCAVPIEGLYKDDLSDEDLHRLQSLIKARIPTSFDSHDAQLPWAKETLKDINSSLAQGSSIFTIAPLIHSIQFIQIKIDNHQFKWFGHVFGLLHLLGKMTNIILSFEF